MTILSKRVGIIGAGQLGAYLCQAAKQLGINTTVLSESLDAPAVTEADETLVAAFDDLDAIRQLCEQVDLVTFEFEDVPDAALDLLERLAKTEDIIVLPRPATLRLIKNKAAQKEWLRAHQFPTSDFAVCDGDADYDLLAARLGSRFVQKSQTGGFDGRGVQVVTAETAATLWQTPSLVEAFVEHNKELSIIVARNPSGEVAVYPLVEQEFSRQSYVLEMALSPADVPAEIDQAARVLGTNIVTELDGVGLFAIELFLTADNKLLVNEIAPRVHNSGHMTMEAHKTSQFEQHLRAITDMPLGDASQLCPAVMVNVLFNEKMQRYLSLPVSSWQPDSPENDTESSQSQTVVHWYGKTEGRPGRKMGHVTSTGTSLAVAASVVTRALTHLSTEEETIS